MRKGFSPDGNYPASALITVSHFARPGMLLESKAWRWLASERSQRDPDM
jgi:hypothetical protein